MSGSSASPDQPLRVNERTGRAILKRVVYFLAVLSVGEIAFALGHYETTWIYSYWAIIWLIGWLSSTLSMTEWTVAGHELRTRRWFSRPGSKTSKIMDLGPDFECVRVAWFGWRIWPYGFSIALQPGQSSRLVKAMTGVGVRIDDWRGEWSRRHPLLNALGVLGYAGGAVAITAVVAMGGLRPGGVGGFATFGAAIAGLCLGLAIDYLPWKMRKLSSREV